MIEPVTERHTGDADAMIAHLGKIGQPELTGRMLLPKDDISLGPNERQSAADAPRQGSADADADLRDARFAAGGHRGLRGGPFDRAIGLRVTRLRRKVEIGPAHLEVIRTVHGAGHIFAPPKD
jgi:hypothetical protein